MKFYNLDDPLNLEYARSRLTGSIVKLEDRAIYVQDIEGEDCYFFYLTDEKRKVDVCDVTDLDITPVELGYSNYESKSFYLTRMPMRRDWRQGLRQLSTNTSTNQRIEIPFVSLGKCIENIYPSFEEAIEKVKNYEVYEKAFSRNFSIIKELVLKYKGRFEVGKVEAGGYFLEPKFEWVRESLEEEMA